MAIRPPARILLAATLSIALLASVAVLVSTRDAVNRLSALRQNRSHNERSNTIVDLRPWQSAQELAALAVTSEEIQYASEAERLADHEVDQAFAAALRQAVAQPRTLKGEALALSKKVQELQQTLREDQARVDALTHSANANDTAKKNANAPATDLDIAKAQLALDADELADEQQDLARVSGDKRSTIQQELADHEAAMRKYDASAHNQGQPATVSTPRHGTLARRIQAWFDQNSRYDLLEKAIAQSQADAAALTTEHDKLETQAGKNGPATEASAEDRLRRLQSRSSLRQLLSIYDDRIQTSYQLASVYTQWADQVKLQHRVVLHLIMQSVALIVVILLFVLILQSLLLRLLRDRLRDARRRQTLQTVARLGVQVAALLLILFIVFGVPAQMPTILGLTTAGLTVALQDFIIAFFGWFILMGKNGIGVGDWVEINGVGGEVAEIGLFRTALLETGNWTDKGHPTGRRVTFVNSFAIKGQFFNFSTSGQWMWDEITFTLPAERNSYEAIERIREAVLEETKADMEVAEREWRRVTQRSGAGVSHFNAGPALDLRPGAFGLDIIVRYVTRASHRYEVKNRLYDRVLNVLGASHVGRL